jgi:hypothetical protein
MTGMFVTIYTSNLYIIYAYRTQHDMIMLMSNNATINDASCCYLLSLLCAVVLVYNIAELICNSFVPLCVYLDCVGTTS